MKKVHNLLTRPEELRKKLESPSFRHDFVQWSKSHLCGQQNRHSRSKSPNEHSKKQFGPSLSKNNNNSSKENIIPNPISKSSSLSKKSINATKGLIQPKLKTSDKTQKRKGQSQSQSHFNSFNSLHHNRSLDESSG